MILEATNEFPNMQRDSPIKNGWKVIHVYYFYSYVVTSMTHTGIFEQWEKLKCYNVQISGSKMIL